MSEQDELKFYKDALFRIASAFGCESPIKLSVLAENNSEDYVDLLIKYIKKKKGVAH